MFSPLIKNNSLSLNKERIFDVKSLLYYLHKDQISNHQPYKYYKERNRRLHETKDATNDGEWQYTRNSHDKQCAYYEGHTRLTLIKWNHSRSYHKNNLGLAAYRLDKQGSLKKGRTSVKDKEKDAKHENIKQRVIGLKTKINFLINSISHFFGEAI